MDRSQLERVERFAPPWVRYMFTMSEAVKTREVWLVVSGDDIAVWSTEEGPTVAIWPARHLADARAQSGHAGEVPVEDFAERVAPLLSDQGILVSVFPNFTDDVLVDASAVLGDLGEFANNPLDVAQELDAPVEDETFDEWVVLERPEPLGERRGPDIGGDEPAVDAAASAPERYGQSLAAIAKTGSAWALANDDGLVGVTRGDEVALAIFPTRDYANAFLAKEAVPAGLEPIDVRALADTWLVVAFAGGWRVAVAPVRGAAAFVAPTRFALDLNEARSGEGS